MVDEIWRCDALSESGRYVNTAIPIASGFFKQHGFWVHDSLVVGERRSVYFPPQPQAMMADFWVRLREESEDIGHGVPSVLAADLARLDTWSVPDFDKQHQAWNTIRSDFWNIVKDVFPTQDWDRISATIMPTNLGTKCSFWRVENSEQIQLLVAYRIDCPIHHLAEGLVSALVIEKMRYELGYSWDESEAFVDLLFEFTGLQRLFPDYVGTLDLLRKPEDRLLAEKSDAYLHKLGFGMPAPQISCVHGRIFLDGGEWLELTRKEAALLTLFLEHPQTLVSFDQIAQLIWPDDPEKFSVWAVSKHIQRLRDRLERAGIDNRVLATRRGRGYVWVGV